MAHIDRSKTFPQAIETAFIQAWPGFRQLDTSDRSHFIMLMLSSFRHKRFAHSHYSDSITYYCRTRDRDFGRSRFQELNAKLKLIEVQEHWQKGDYTKGYRITDEARTLIESIPLQTTKIVDTKGVIMKKAATWAINERDLDGNHRKGKGNLSAVIQVDIDELYRLLIEAREWRWHFKDEGPKPEGRRLEPRLNAMPGNLSRRAWLANYLIAPLTLFCMQADTDFLPKGQMEVTYTETQSGRLYAVGGSIQSVPREIRSAALRGHWDYDIENCHYSLIAQLAHRAGKATPVIDHYLTNKKAVRASLVADLDLSLKHVKDCLIAILYGATQRVTEYEGKLPAIAKMIGPDKAQALFDHPAYSALVAEVKTIRKPILDTMPINKLKLINHFGKGIDRTEQLAVQLSHVLQGCEAAILNTVIDQHGSNLRALMHDGWVSATRLDRAALEAEIEAATSFKVTLEETLIV